MKTIEDNILTWDNIPEWAIYALEYGVDSDDRLTDDNKSQITDFIESNFPHGYTFSVRWDERNEFDRFPAFGLPCATYTADFVRL